jgi:hypothetical protein
LGKFKETHGKSRIGKFIEQKAPGLLDMVGDVTGIGGFDLLGKLIDGNQTLDSETKEKANALLQQDINAEMVRNIRHATDMASDSWLSKNIRPLTLIFLLLIFSAITIIDSASGSFDVKQEYITLYGQLLLTAFSFYFVLRGVEKIMITKKMDNG